jgi:hypothetical protein
MTFTDRSMRKLATPLLLAATLLLAAPLLLAACGKRDAGSPDAATNADAAALPGPESGNGSVTGMPDHPGPGPVGVPDADALPPDTPVASDGDGQVLPVPADDAGALPQDAQPGNDGSLPPPPPTATTEPSPDDAVAVVRQYYAAIDQHDYARAWHLWSDAGHASGKSLQQFSDGFVDTMHASVQTQVPGRVDAGAGQRYIEVPVTITAQQSDGSTRHYTGTYTLHRTVVDGASDEQRAWRINSAEIHETD